MPAVTTAARRAQRVIESDSDSVADELDDNLEEEDEDMDVDDADGDSEHVGESSSAPAPYIHSLRLLSLVLVLWPFHSLYCALHVQVTAYHSTNVS